MLVYPIVLCVGVWCVSTEIVSCAVRTQNLCTTLKYSANNSIHNFVAWQVHVVVRPRFMNLGVVKRRKVPEWRYLNSDFKSSIADDSYY
jgi:hypothetical protein